MPRAFDQKAKDRFIALVSRGRAPVLVAEDLNFAWTTIQRHLREDRDFMERFDQAVASIDARVQEVALDLALSGEHPASTWKWLERRRRDEWGETKTVSHTVSGPGGGPIQVAAVTTQALREVLIGGDTREQALAMIDEIPAIEATASEVE